MNKTKFTTFLLTCLCISTISFAGCDFLGESSSEASSSSSPSSEAETSESTESTISSSEAGTSESTESTPSVEEQRETLKAICKDSFAIKNYTVTLDLTRNALNDGKPYSELNYEEALTLKFDGNKTYAHDIVTSTINDEYSSETFEYFVWQGTSFQHYERYATWDENEWRIEEYHENHEEYNGVTYMRVIEYDRLLDIIINNLSYDAETGLYVSKNILLESNEDEEEYAYAYVLDVSIQIKDGKWYQASWTIQSNYSESGNMQVTQTGSATFTDYDATVVNLPDFITEE